MKMLIPQAFSSRTAGNAFLQMYMDRGNISRQLTAYRSADGIDQGYNKSMGTTQGKEDNVAAQYDTMKTALGLQLLPILNSVLEKLLSLVSAVKWFADTFPNATKFILGGVAALGILLLVMGGLLIIVTSILSPILALRGTMFMLSFAFGSVDLALAPIILLVGLFAVLAYLVWRNWAPIKEFFVNLWQELKNACSGGISGISEFIQNWSPIGLFYKAFAVVLSWFDIILPPQFTDFGANLIHSLAQGIMNAGGEIAAAFDNIIPKQLQMPALNAIPGIGPALAAINGIRTLSGSNSAHITKTGIKTTSTTPLMMRNQQPYSVTHAPVIHITGVTDPVAVGHEVKKQLDASQRKVASQQRSALVDHH